jgi:hypothetical protein
MNLSKIEPKGSNTLSFIVEDRTYVTGQQILFGHEIKKVAGIPLDTKLFLQNRKPWVDNLIENDEEVDLAREGLEYFFIEKDFQLKVNEAVFHWKQRYITGKQVIKLANLEDDDLLFFKTVDNRIDQLIGEDDKVDLLEPGIEKFYTKENDKKVSIYISGVLKEWDNKKISFKEVVILAYGNYEDRPTMVYTVAYEDGPKKNPEGSMIKGSEVFVKHLMIFHATATDKS